MGVKLHDLIKPVGGRKKQEKKFLTKAEEKMSNPGDPETTGKKGTWRERKNLAVISGKKVLLKRSWDGRLYKKRGG